MKDRKASSAPSEKSLDSLRSKIQDITKAILDLVKARQNLSEKVALVKASKNLAVENKQVESKLIKSVEVYARKIGLDGRFARHLAMDLVESSKSAQRRAIYVPKIKRYLLSNDIDQVGIVGAGRMGGWFASYFEPLVKRVMLFDINTKFGKRRAKELGCVFSGTLSGLMTSGLILVAVPIGDTANVTNLLLKLARKKAKPRIFEISSVKESVIRRIGKYNTGLYFIHPLFGSSVDQFAENSMILVGSKKRVEDDFVRGIFPHFKIQNLTAREHDKLMTLLLSLPHALALIFASIISEKKPPDDVSSPSYESLIQISRKALSENPKVYYEIQSLNKQNQTMLSEIKESVVKLDSLLSSGDYQRFESLFSKAQAMLSKL